MPEPETKPAPRWAPLLMLGTVFLLFFAPVLSGDNTFFFRDTTHNNYPIKFFLAEAFKEGRLPFWNPYVFNGYPFLAEWHPGVFYPPSLIFLLDPFPLAFNGYFLFHYAVLAFSVYALTRYWGVCRAAALAAALTALLGGYFLSLIFYYTPLQTATWFPAGLYCLDRALRGSGAVHGPALVVVTALQALGGSPEACALSGGVYAAYAVFRVEGGLRPREMGRRALLLSAVAALAFGLTAIQLLPAGALIGHSVRGGGLSFDDHAIFSMELPELAQLAAPPELAQLMETDSNTPLSYLMSRYMGFFALLALASAAWLWREGAVRFWTGVTAFGLFFALGKTNPVYPVLFEWIPVFKLFRFPEKFFYLAAFGLVFLVAHVFDAWWNPERRAALSGRGGGVSLLLAAGVVILGEMARPGRTHYLALTLIVLFAGAWVLFRLRKMDSQVFQTLALLMLYLDLNGAHNALLPVVDKGFYANPPELALLLRKEQEPVRIYSEPVRAVELKNAPVPVVTHGMLQWAKRERLFPDLGMLYGVSDAAGQIGLELDFASEWRARFNAARPQEQRRILERGNVKYWITNPVVWDEQRDPPMVLRDSLEALEHPLPRAFLVGRARAVSAGEAADRYYDAVFDPRQEVLLEETPPLPGSDAFHGSVTGLSPAADRTEVRTRQDAPGYLVLLDTWFPGWSVTVDGKPAPLLRANRYFRAVALDAGEHTVVFEFVPEGYRTGRAVTWASGVLLLGWFAATRLRRS